MAKQDKDQKDLQQNRKSLQKRITEPIVSLLVKMHITPNQLTWFGFLLTVAAAVLILLKLPIWAGVVVLVGSAFDMLDGGVARATGTVSKRGEFLDSTLDRVSEGVLFISIIISYNSQVDLLTAGLAASALFLSLLVSYLRAKAEVLSLPKTVGFFTRPERMLTLIVGLILAGFFSWALPLALGIIVVCSFITALQRAVYIWKNL